MNIELNQCLKQLYRETGIPADALATSPESREKFAAEVRDRTGQKNLTAEHVIRQLLRLRKTRQLPRLRR